MTENNRIQNLYKLGEVIDTGITAVLAVMIFGLLVKSRFKIDISGYVALALILIADSVRMVGHYKEGYTSWFYIMMHFSQGVIWLAIYFFIYVVKLIEMKVTIRSVAEL